MALIIPDAEEAAFLSTYFNVAALSDGHDVHLYTNDPTAGLTPSEVDQLGPGDFTEATFTGYAAVNVSGGWTVTPGDPTEAVAPTAVFACSADGAAQAVRGYYVTREAGTLLAWFEPFPGAVTVEFLGDELHVTPRMTLDDREGSDVQTGTITAFGGDTAPTGWLMCDGAAVSRSTYADLFAVVGEAYGAGDGSTTFNVPDLQQRFPLGKAASGTGASLGDTGGAIDHVHNLDNASAHAQIAVQGDRVRGRQMTGPSWTTTTATDATATLASAQVLTTAAELAGDTDAENPPFVVVNYMIRA